MQVIPWYLGILLLLHSTLASSQADDTTALQEYPPTGERLRVLADRLNFQIGYAAKYDFASLNRSDLHQQVVSQEFNIVTPENSMKWELSQPDQGGFDFTDMDTLRGFADAHGMALHGHPLVWYRQLPAWVEALPASELETVMRLHIDTVVRRYAQRVEVWDVVNEALNDEGTGFRESPFLAAMGPAYIDIAFETARAADPTARLLYNDYKVGWLTPKADAMYDLVVDMQSRGVPLDGVGLQMHIEHTFEHAEGFSSNMQRFADRGLDIYITEFDVGVEQPENYQRQAMVYEETISRCLMQPLCKALQIWGVDDFYSWRAYVDPLPFDDEFRVKPAYYGMQRALSGQPVHVETCEAAAGEVRSGSIYSLGSEITCRGVSLSSEYNSVWIRYRNPGAATASVVLYAGGSLLASAMLPPVAGSAEGDYATLQLPLGTVDGNHDITLVFGGEAADVGIDALMFRNSTGSPLTQTDAVAVDGSETLAVVSSDITAESTTSTVSDSSADAADEPVTSGGGVMSWLVLLLVLLTGIRGVPGLPGTDDPGRAVA